MRAILDSGILINTHFAASGRSWPSHPNPAVILYSKKYVSPLKSSWESNQHVITKSLNERKLPVSPCYLWIVTTCPFLKEGCEPDKKKTLKDPYKEGQIREGKRNSSQWRISCESTTFTSSPRKGGDDSQQTPLKLESGISTSPSGLQGQPCSDLMFTIWCL